MRSKTRYWTVFACTQLAGVVLSFCGNVHGTILPALPIPLALLLLLPGDIIGANLPVDYSRTPWNGLILSLLLNAVAWYLIRRLLRLDSHPRNGQG